MNKTFGSNTGAGQWWVNTVVALATAVVVGVLVVGLTVIADRFNSPVIEISRHDGFAAVVHISGAVATPGLYTIDPNGRLVDALDAAGGLTTEADVTQLNLAARLGDGESIVVPSIAGDKLPGADVSQANSGRVNVNSASAEELETLPGIGPVIADRIVHDREANGPYPVIENLTRVQGISTTTLDELRPLVTAGD